MTAERVTEAPFELYDGPRPDWQQAGLRHIWMPYTQMANAPLPLPVVATRGVRLELPDGRHLIDGMASWWSSCHGYNHPHLVGAVRAQLERMPHVMFGGINHEPALNLARRLAQALPGELGRVFFSDSGSVAVEVALKMAVQYGLNRGERGRHRFVSFRRAYHGDTTGAMSVCDPDTSMHSHFQGFLLEQHVLELPRSDAELADFEAFVATHRRQLAGVILEPLVQGAGGMRFHAPETLAGVARVCREHEVLLILDEIATGFGRTGSLFACEQAGVVPDIICLGKALTGGLMGLAATVATETVFDAFQWRAGVDDPSRAASMALMHGPTFMANALACAAANASLDLFEREDRLARALALESQLARELEPCRDLPGVVDVRAKGAIGVVQVDGLDGPRELDWMKRRFVDEGVWIRPFGDVVYVTPALVMSPGDVSTLTAAIVRVLGEWAERRQSGGGSEGASTT